MFLWKFENIRKETSGYFYDHSPNNGRRNEAETIPVRFEIEHTWQVFDLLQWYWGDFNACPDCRTMKEKAKQWEESYGAELTRFSHDTLTFQCPSLSAGQAEEIIAQAAGLHAEIIDCSRRAVGNETLIDERDERWNGRPGRWWSCSRHIKGLCCRIRNGQADFHRCPRPRRALDSQAILGAVIQREPAMDIGEADVPAIASGILPQLQGRPDLPERLPVHAPAIIRNADRERVAVHPGRDADRQCRFLGSVAVPDTVFYDGLQGQRRDRHALQLRVDGDVQADLAAELVA